MACEANIEISKDTGWINETVFFTVTGDEVSVRNFKHNVHLNIERHNNQ